MAQVVVVVETVVLEMYFEMDHSVSVKHPDEDEALHFLVKRASVL